LSNCIGIPIEDVLALSQVVDGYDRPVNGVLSHTFVKGAYADKVLKKSVDWASYASTKLKSQITEWERDRKPKHIGPPCVQKPCSYVAPLTAKEPREADVARHIWHRVRKRSPGMSVKRGLQI
jgi:hypothetical protein